MPDNKKKKSQLAQEAYEQQAQQLEKTGQEVVSGLTSAGEQYQQSLDAANQARTEAYNQAQQLYKQRMDEGYTQFADIIAGEQKRAEQAEQDAIEQYNAERQAARWTGATELAASIANLVSVGGHNAVSQQYHSYSQDWMKKADENWRQNRARFDNLRDRQRALQQQLTQLKMGDAGTALNLATRQADQAYQHGAQSAQIGYQTATAPMNVKMQTAKEAGAARTQGVVTGINVDLHEQQLEQQKKASDANIAQGWARVNQAQAELDMKAQQSGFTPDPDRPGKYKIDTSSDVYKNAVAAGKVRAGSAGSGSGSGNWYNVTVGGKNYALNMNKETREQAMRDGKDELKKDILAMSGAASWDELVAGTGKKGKYKEYAAIADALDGNDPDEDNKTISDFFDKNRGKCEHMGEHLFRVASGARDFGGATPGPSGAGGTGFTGGQMSGEDFLNALNK